MAVLLTLIAEGRGDDPSGPGGVLIVVGIVIGAAVLLGLLAMMISSRRARSRSQIFRRRRDRGRRIGRIN